MQGNCKAGQKHPIFRDGGIRVGTQINWVGISLSVTTRESSNWIKKIDRSDCSKRSWFLLGYTFQNLLFRLRTYLLSKNIPRTNPYITPPINSPSFLPFVDFLAIFDHLKQLKFIFYLKRWWISFWRLKQNNIIFPHTITHCVTHHWVSAF